MKGRMVFGSVFSVMLLFLSAGSGLAGEPQPTGPSGAVGLSAGSMGRVPWVNVEVDTPNNTGKNASLAFDRLGRPHVSYYDATHGDLRLADWVGSEGNCGPGGSWQCQTIDGGEADVGRFSSIAASVSTRWIAYYDATNGWLKFAIVTEDQVDLHTVDKGVQGVSATGLYPSLVRGSVLPLYVAYHFVNEVGVDALRVASWWGNYAGNCGFGDQEGVWQCETVDTGEGVGQHASLAVDGDGELHIAYYDAGAGDLRYARSGLGGNCGSDTDDWSCYTVDGLGSDAGKFASLYLDDDSLFHIAYYDATRDALKYAHYVGAGGNCGDGNTSRCEEIDAMPADYHPVGVSMAQDAAGQPIIAYQSEFGSLNLARPAYALGLWSGAGNCGPGEQFQTWFCATLHRYGSWNPYRNGDVVSVGVNRAGLAAVAYQEFITSEGANLAVSYQRPQVLLPLVLMQL